MYMSWRESRKNHMILSEDVGYRGEEGEREREREREGERQGPGSLFTCF